MCRPGLLTFLLLTGLPLRAEEVRLPGLDHALRIPPGYKRSEETPEGAVGEWKRALPCMMAAVPDELTALVVPLAGEVSASGGWARGQAFVWGPSARTMEGDWPGARTMSGPRKIDGIQMDYVAALLPSGDSAIVLLLRGGQGREGALFADVEYVTRRLTGELGGARAFRVQELDLAFTVPEGFVRVDETPAGVLAQWTRTESGLEVLTVALSSAAGLDTATSEWKEGRDYTWAPDSGSRWGRLWVSFDPRCRYHEGIRQIEGADEIRLAAIFPAGGQALAVFLKGSARAERRLKQDMATIALSLGAQKGESSFHTCGGCGGGGFSSKASDGNTGIILGGLMAAVFVTLLAFRKARPAADSGTHPGRNARFLPPA